MTLSDLRQLDRLIEWLTAIISRAEMRRATREELELVREALTELRLRQ